MQYSVQSSVDHQYFNEESIKNSDAVLQKIKDEDKKNVFNYKTPQGNIS